ncbi:gamma-glutamyltransferase 2. Threonine peptidase. MEROPS family T03 [Colwellia chukchiensis]|uniref:Glutathione hydrolase proenzyme n=1 Tax=Colwellia chukchiensis TaxID=641665 RepID=A0A1H7GXZ4_9GAMM|nr:gamma-glutamyltransferase [Colwellia chukchiensis]SEK42908.1 gamma-glutamyltransferase 2. Threonine peptidase. MEROPS family T03 [Colwellia chukchiensis]
MTKTQASKLSKLSKLVIFLGGTLILAFNASADRITGDVQATRSEVIAANGMVATSQPLATQIGLQILKAGGNAIDAAIAANAALGLMEPTGNGIGGDLFAIIWHAKSQKLYGLNASGRSPQSLTFAKLKTELAALKRDDIPPYGMLPISVPGTVDGWFEMHDKFGHMAMKELLAPAIDYANNGFPVSELIAYYWQRSVPRLSVQVGSFKETFTLAGKAPRKGQIFKNPALGNTLSLIAEQGRSAFYQGEIADKIDAFMKANGGYITRADLSSHTSTWVEPVSTNYRGYDVFELPPNGQGIAALQMLNILESYDLAKMGFLSEQSLHVMTEAKKLAFEDRAKFYADPAFYDVPLQGLLDKRYAMARKKQIGTRAAKRVDVGNPAMYQGDTIYLTTADKAGNMVSLIQSNYRGMGSGVVVPGLGFVFQDRGQLFSMDESHANVYQPNKRPFHTIIPAFVMKDQKPFMSFGLMGGAMQPQGHVQIITNIIDFGMNLQEAGDATRWQHYGSTEPTEANGKTLVDGGQLVIESNIPYQTVRGLIQRGHKVGFDVGGYGGYQAIMWDDKEKVYYGASESRKDGQAAGY